MRIFVLSDIHIDFPENKKWVGALSAYDYQKDALILAGDVSHDFNQLRECLFRLKNKFARVFFVPGNHDLWVRQEESGDSLAKLEQLLAFCKKEEIRTTPVRLGSTEDAHPVWLVPLLSWYAPVESEHSLFLPKPGEDADNRMWSDNYFIRWPDHKMQQPDQMFYQKTQNYLQTAYDAPVISISHFLPRTEMMFSRERVRDQKLIRKYDRHPGFNFSRVAGSLLIERQLRSINSAIHIYGHQHINRDRILDGVRYVAHCLGYPEERNRGTVRGIDQGLKLVWDTSSGEVGRQSAESGGGEWALQEGL